MKEMRFCKVGEKSGIIVAYLLGHNDKPFAVVIIDNKLKLITFDKITLLVNYTPRSLSHFDDDDLLQETN